MISTMLSALKFKTKLNNKNYLIKTILAITALLPMANASEQNNYYPKAILQLSPYFSHHVIVAEKSTHTLYLFANENGLPKLVTQYQIATGKKAGDKIFQGDFRTPEGIYHFTEFLTHAQLLEKHGQQGEIYGVGAFVMNYPNPIDQSQGKTGGGIWLHSTNDETRIDKGLDSRGCIVAHNQNLIKISDYIELDKTNIIVVHDMNYLNEAAWQAERAKLNQMVQGWLTAWQEENLEDYISYYSPKDFKDATRGNYNNYKSYKKAVFSNPGKPEISLSDVSILQTQDYAVVTFIQNYSSNSINDTGKKILYLTKDEFYNWKIVSEKWSKLNEDIKTNYAFEPSQRFFSSTDPKQIFTKVLNLTTNQDSTSMKN